MNNQNFKIEFAKAISILALTLGENTYTEARGEAYFETLKSYGRDAVLTAIKQAMITCKFFPKPAELVEIMTGGKGGGQDPSAAWQQVLLNLERHGSYKSVEFEDGAIAAAIEMLGGWADLGAMSYEDMTLQRIPSRFESLYREAVRQGRHLQPGRVIGRHEIQNGANYPQLETPRAQAALTGTQIMDKATPRPSIKLLDPYVEPVEIPADLRHKANNLAARLRLN